MRPAVRAYNILHRVLASLNSGRAAQSFIRLDCRRIKLTA